MKRLILSLLLFISLSAVAQLPFDSETVSYKIMYKWGLINKQAGRATLTFNSQGDKYNAQLVARSEKWADKYYRVRDTLSSEISKADFRPQIYEKIAHEGGDDKHDIVRFEYSGTNVVGQCSRVAYKDGKLKTDQQQTLHATGKVVDMLSSFYYMRSLPFETWNTGDGQTVTIFSGKRKEELTFKYRGIEEVKVEDKTYTCYRITFIFTSKGGKKTSDDMDAWITTDESRRAVLLEGKLPIGKVRCFIM